MEALKPYIIGWLVLSVLIIYWDIQRRQDKLPLSKCHKAAIKIYHEKPMCMECKLFCEVI